MENTAPTTEAPVKKASSKKKKTLHQVSHGRAYVQSTFNNTIVTVTDLNGNTLAWSSSGACGFRGPKKSTPYAASMIVKSLTDKLKPYGVRDLSVFVCGVGSGRESALRSLNTAGFNIVSIKDLTPIPHNGCRSPKPRRM